MIEKENSHSWISTCMCDEHVKTKKNARWCRMWKSNTHTQIVLMCMSVSLCFIHVVFLRVCICLCWFTHSTTTNKSFVSLRYFFFFFISFSRPFAYSHVFYFVCCLVFTLLINFAIYFLIYGVNTTLNILHLAVASRVERFIRQLTHTHSSAIQVFEVFVYILFEIYRQIS